MPPWRAIRCTPPRSPEPRMYALRLIFAPGFFSNGPVHTALMVGGGAAIVCAVVGVFTVIRGQTFTGHALADMSSAGGSAAFLLGVSPLFGFLGMSALAAGGMQWADVRDARERDLLTGVMLGGGLGLTALLLYFNSVFAGTGAAITVLFGSMFTIPAAIVPAVLALAATALAAIATVYRPLLMSALSEDLAQAQGARVKLIGLVHALALALAVSLAAMTVGAILCTALLIGPAAAALRVADRPGRSLTLAVLIGLASTWGGILLAYDSFYWTPGRGWPVSFFIVLLIFVAYLSASLIAHMRERGIGRLGVYHSGCEQA